MDYKNAVILLNMGGPNSLDEVSVFLKNMFADPYILSIPTNMLRSMVGSAIVNSRIEKSKEIYKAIGGYSPITQITFSLTQKLQKENSSTFYSYAMRYTPPFCKDVLKEIKDKGIEDITLFSMYPQYSTTTTLSSFTDAANALKELEYKPKVSIIERYFDNPIYIESIVNSIEKKLLDSNASDFTLICSAHSIPLSRVKKGDPYKSECEKTFELINIECKKRGMEFQKSILSYQSKLGPVKWLTPDTNEILKENKNSKVIIYPLSFTIDNSETLYELSIDYKNLAKDLNITDYRVCPCLNDSDDFMRLILSLSNV